MTRSPSETKISGRCLCGAVTYACDLPPVFMGKCYCEDCSRESRTGHIATMAVPDAGLRVDGALSEYTKVSDDGHTLTKFFCPTCGTTLFTRPEKIAGLAVLRAGTLQDRSALQPQLQMYVARAALGPPGRRDQVVSRDGDRTVRAARARLDTLMSRGAAFLGSEVAILCGAMSWVSERRLVAAMSDAGGFGLIACGAMTPELLDEEIAGTKALTAKPFGVNLITMHPDLSALIDVCVAHEVGHVVLAGGLPPGGAIERIKAGGAKVICFAPALALARKLIRSGVDALVIEGMEAGGHIGPVSTSVLAQEMLPEIAERLPVFVAGGIGRGEAIAGYLEMGAAGVQLGTRFVCATESVAHPAFKQAFLRASARDAVASVQIDPRLPVIPVRALRNAGGELFAAKQREVAQALDEGRLAMAEAQLQIEHYWAGALRRAVIDGDVEHGSLMAGQSVGMVTREEPIAAILATLLDEAETALGRRAG